MKKIVTLALTLTCGAVLAQKNDNVGIGTTKPDPSAILDLSSTSKGFLLPRMTQTQREAIQTPATGLMVFQTDQTVGTYVFDGTTWQPTARVGTTATVGAWDLQGNIIDATDYIGSDNDFPLVFKVNNIRAGFLDNSGNANVFFGVNSGIGNTSYWNTGLGVGTLSAALTGNSNTAVGRFSMNKNTTGTANTSIGVQSLENNTQGDYNMAVGVFALRSNTLGDNNAAIGSQALQFNQTGNSNLALGTNALFNNISGSENIAIGQGALFGAMSGSISQNTAIGTSAGQNATGSGNVFLGYSAGANETGSNMLYISNSVTNSPLLKGSFSATAPWLRINVKSAPMSPTPTTTG
nr:hypothetical protein [Spirosomataceae bacterium]